MLCLTAQWANSTSLCVSAQCITVPKHNIIMSEANNITSLPPESKSTANRALVFFYEGLTIGRETETTDEGYKPMNI
jgi:hypothetical protein